MLGLLRDVRFLLQLILGLSLVHLRLSLTALWSLSESLCRFSAHLLKAKLRCEADS